MVKDLIHRKAGIYALYRRNQLYYVGLASGLQSRLKQHLRDRHRNRWDSFSLYLTVRDEHMKELESLLLRVAKPPGNKVRGKFAHSESLYYELSRRMREEDERRRARLLRGRDADRFRKRKVRHSGIDALAGLFDRSVPLRGRLSGKLVRATLRTDGHIRIGRKMFNSLSSAARALGTVRNGWTFWSFRDPQTRVWRQLSSIRG